ncbi:MAG: hypothetical protein ABIP39_13930 [Polyangiaceae bacterium]
MSSHPRITWAFEWWCGRVHLQPTRANRIVRIALTAGALLVGGNEALVITKGIWSAETPQALPPDGAGTRFGVAEQTRREVFSEIAQKKPGARDHARERFPADQVWRREDDRSASERDTVRNAASGHKLNVTQVYLILDEGIREHWPGVDGKPLTPKTIPLLQRSP